MTFPAVLDASAAIGLVLKDRRVGEIRATLRQANRVLAPTLFQTEVANGLWRHAMAEERPAHWVHPYHQDALGLVGWFHDDKSLVAEALTEAVARKHPVYDFLYFVLARRYGARLLTLDRRLGRLAREEGLDVVNPLDS